MTATPPRATISDGRLLGERDGRVAVFRGIPFAAPPVGELRWAPPRRPDRWDGERRATEFGPAPMQPQPPTDTLMYHSNFADRRAIIMSEDCLYLNVWTPEPAPHGGLPVMVWIHGGGNRYGHGSQDIYDGRAMAGRGVVFVTLNHRLGALGFLAHPALAAHDDIGATGNYGLHDILAALTWVRENIAALGGDPDQVTLAGNSAGAAHICHLMAAPAARPLFRAAIGQSAGGIGRAEGPLPDQAQAQKQGLQYAEPFNAHDAASLRRISALELIARGHFGPVVDGALLGEPTDEVFAAGRQHPVPLLVGTNRDEGTVYASAADVARIPDGPEFRGLYPRGGEAEALHSAALYVGETRFVLPVWHWARTHHATSGAATWMYRFDRKPPLPEGLKDLGVYHTAELPYVLDNLDRRSADWPWRAEDRVLAAAMADTWARFARTCDPNDGALPAWPVYTGADGDSVLHFGETVAAAPLPRTAVLRLLDARRPT